MQDSFQQPSAFSAPPVKKASSGTKILLWVLGGVGVFFLLICGGSILSLAYIGTIGPETSVYTANRVPKRFVKTMEEVGALEEGETLLYFYSDAITDIRNGFYFVSDRKVCIYNETTGVEPLTAIPFEEITDATLSRDESFIGDSQIILILDQDRPPVSFPVSSEFDRDEAFFEEIRSRLDVAQ